MPCVETKVCVSKASVKPLRQGIAVSGDAFLRGFGRRLRAARLWLDSREPRPVGNAELGRRIGVLLGKTNKAVHESAVGRWGRTAVPDARTVAAIGQACGVDPGWLAFGDASAAPAPATWGLVATSADEDAERSAMEALEIEERERAGPANPRRPASRSTRRRAGGG